ncbi:ABC transporter permease [Streptomyces sp. NPDC017529]|uniref:ABC transporter permease n=1 Tax=Streptomyces sp. NPDC017529 TaxID=3365000 RepID=UPI00378DD8D5
MSAFSRTADGAGARQDASAGSKASTARPGLLHGTTWLVWRRHRGTFLVAFAVTALACAAFAYQRPGVMDFLTAHPYRTMASAQRDGDPLMKFQDAFSSMFSSDTSLLLSVPIAFGVFLGAPLIAAEQEQGTLRLAATQSVTRGRWIAAKLAVPLAVVFVCTSLMSAAFTWMWEPAHELAAFGDWYHGGILETTGPAPVARALLFTVVGIAVGMLLRRVIASMAVALVFGYGFNIVWEAKVLPLLAPLRRIVFPYDEEGMLPGGAVSMDTWLATADGRVFGIGNCTDGDTEACRAQLGIVNRAIDYYGYDQMAGIQWLDAGLLVALAAAVTVFIVWWARRRPL